MIIDDHGRVYMIVIDREMYHVRTNAYNALYTYIHKHISFIYIIYIHILENPLHFCIFCITETFLQFRSRCTAEEITPAEGEIFWEDGEFCMALNYQ